MQSKGLFLSAALCLMVLGAVQAQNHDGLYGNEWINHAQSYYKMRVAADGLYRLSAATLQAAGVNTSNPANLQLFRMGQQVPLHVQTNAGQLEYVEFYGRKHRGELDRHLYSNPQHWFNQEFSLVSDTMAYFLTAGSAPGLRYTEQSANLSNLPPKENHCWFPGRFVYTTGSGAAWNPGRRYQVSTEQLSKSLYEYGEGFGSSTGSIFNVVVPTPNAVSGGPNAQVSARLYAMRLSGLGSIDTHRIEVRIGNTTLGTHTLIRDSVATLADNAAVSLLGAANTTVQLRVVTGMTAAFTVAHVEIEYPRSFNFGGASAFAFRLKASSARRYLEMTGINPTGASAQTIYLYDLTNHRRIQCFWDGVKAMTDLPASSADMELLLVNTAAPGAWSPMMQLQPVQFTPYSDYGWVDYMMVTHNSLRNDGMGDPVLEYAAFRASKGFAPHIADIDELYNQFAYGIDYHPIAVRNFALYMRNNVWGSGGIPRYLFLVGKGRDYNQVRVTVPSELKIPAYGAPVSDQVGVAPFGSKSPSVAVGRLAASTAGQVRLYLNKMLEMETLLQGAASTPAERAWTKNVLHLGGGADAYQQNLISGHLNTMKATAQAPHFGANVESFFKTSSAPIQAAQSAFLDSLINSGTALITFFGHSSANSFDFNLDYPGNYTNQSKYPLILALGCYGGTISAATPLISEQFVFEPDAGAAVFLASTGAAALSALNAFAQQFYNYMSGSAYGKGGGHIMREAIRHLESVGWLSNSTTIEMVCEYMSYHGDPAFDMHAHLRPDYYIDAGLVSHSPNVVTTQMDEFTLHLDVRNLGRAIDTVFWVEITRQYADGQTIVLAHRQQMTAPYHTGILDIVLPIDGANPNTLGVNVFTIKIDADEEIAELPDPAAEQNNIVLQYAIHILSDAVLPVYPYEFAIVPETPIKLKASTGQSFAPIQSYRIQLDTTEYFNSPLFQQTVITQSGGLLEWTPPMAFQDSLVYYWRVSVDTVATGLSPQWAYSSFIYLNGSYPGWNQSHFFQYHKDRLHNIELPEGPRTFNYISSLQEITLTNGYTPNPLLAERLSIYLNGNQLDKCRCPSSNGIYVTVLDSADLEVWELPGPLGNSLYGAINCDLSGRTAKAFLFPTLNNPAAQDSLQNFLQNVIPDGFYVLAYSLNNAGISSWQNAQVVNEWLNQGGDANKFSLLQNTSGGLPFAFFYQKNNFAFPYKVTELGNTQMDIIELSGLIPGSWYRGYLESTRIGPALEWTHLYWDHSALDALPGDVTEVDVFGVDALGNRTLLIENLTQLDTSLTGISTQAYPYLQMQWHTSDQLHKTSPQLDYWRIQSAMVPEAALRADLYLLSQFDTVQRGQDFRFSVAMQNISATDMDSMLVKFHILGDTTLHYQRLAPLPAGDTLWATFHTTTFHLGGWQQLLVEINPDNDQPERYHFNNIGLYRFFVAEDRINPLLDVTFDGVHIMNGDIVSGKPEIQIMLTDENRYLALDRPEDFTLLLRHPSLPNGEMALNQATANVQFFPGSAGAGQNRARLVARPELPHDGTYTLFVSAKDRSGNNSGKLQYNVDFEVINRPMISNVLNYPNPFTTSTRFVFTLTGVEPPDEVRIQIMNINGVVVREISKHELGPMRIGINRSEFAWDGTDQYGDRLANGVYLYKVTALKNGQPYEMYRNNRIDQYFQGGFGKMYLMR